MSKVAPVHVILGNHDGLMQNKHRQDAISPIISALDNSRIFLYKDSGTYPTGIPGFNWCVFSCFDEKGWEKAVPIEGDINIALFHGAVWGSATDIDWEIEGEVTVDLFEDYDFALLGDIHKQQFLNDKKTIAYCGSSIQQNYGEDTGKGFLLWDIESKDKFTSTFYEISHTRPFITIDWTGDIEDTIGIAKTFIDGSRFRIRSDKPIQQNEINILYSRLKDEKRATEIVFKCDQVVDSQVIKLEDGTLIKDNLRDANTHKKLISSYYSNLDLTKKESDELYSLVAKYLSQASHSDEISRNIRWSIKSLKFDNTFAYGKNNYINFENLSGITGIFGKNRRGKSSIIGTIMYNLFNTTDRGTIKNIHIVNSRKPYCNSEIVFNANGTDYLVERQTVKHQTRKGSMYASTGLNLKKVDCQKNEIQDLNGEQRRETEKVLRKLIGTSDDFLLTSVASQGEMNTFIKEKATSRKLILSKFLDLTIFDKMHDLAKEESSDLRSQVKNLPLKNWQEEIEELKGSVKNQKSDIKILESDLLKKRQRLQDLKIRLATSPDSDIVTLEEVNEQKELVESIKSSVVYTKSSIVKEENKRDETSDIILKINNVMSDFPISLLNEKVETKRNLEKSIVKLDHELEKQKTLLDDMKKSVKRLSEVPCGDSFPKCKFIKDSHSNKGKIDDQQQSVRVLRSQIRASRKVLNTLQKEEIEEKIEKYNTLVTKLGNEKVKLSHIRMKINQKKMELESITRNYEDAKSSLSDLELRCVEDEMDSESIKIKRKIGEISSEISNLDAKRISAAENLGKNESNLKNLRSQSRKFKNLSDKLKVFDLFMQATSKNGIPKQIIRSQLPVINAEISKILQGVTGFTVELEAESDSNSMDIYINYGDSKRVIELASGMEKMMASLAIRVALINVSSLPKTDLLVIDEGFGALDEMNIEVCSRLLESLKKWFKNIIIISHVDAIKDSVDNVLDISWAGTNAKVHYD